MDRSRLEFLKTVAKHFQENPQAKDCLGVSKETCFSTLGLYFSLPENILDHTDPDFLNDLNERISLVESRLRQNQSLPETVDRHGGIDKTVDKWQGATKRTSSPAELEKIGKGLEKKLQGETQAAWRDIDQQAIPRLNQARLGVFKNIVGHFEANPSAPDYLGLSRQTCFSTLGLYFSTKDEILDPTGPEFLKKAGEKIIFWEGVKTESLIPVGEEGDYKALAEGMRRELTTSVGEDKIAALEQAVREKTEKKAPLEANEQKMRDLLTVEDGIKNQPPQRQSLPVDLDRTFRQWQGEIKKLEAVGKTEGLGEEVLQKKRRQISQRFEPHLQNQSLRGWKKIAPKLAPKMEWFLKSAGKIAKFTGPVGFALMAGVFSAEIIKQTVKILGPAIYLIYNFFAALGTAAMIGAIIGGVAGGLAGGIGGAILGAKLGATIGFAMGGPVGAVIGGILGGITGFAVGVLAGTALGAAIGGAVGYAIEHWLWQPLQNFWVGAGNVLGGAGSFLAGAWSGFWIGAGNFLSGALSAVGGAATAAGGFVAGLGAGLSTISLPASAVTVPVLGATGGVFALTLWMNTSIVGTAFMRQPAPQVAAPPPVVSEYLSLNKTGAFSGVGSPINYSLTLTAKNRRLENIQIADETTFNCVGTPPSVSRKTPGPIASLDPNQTSTLNYSTDTNPQFNNCTVTNTATATLNVPDEGKTGQTASVSFSVTIGSPPAPSCPIPSGVITCGSYTAGCHCRPGYILYPCTNNPTAPFAIDVAGPSRGPNYDVYLPAVKGITQWQLTKEGEVRDGPPYYYYWGWERIFFGTSNGINYTIRFLHIINNPPLEINGKWYPVGTKVGRLWEGTGWNGPGGWGPHVHVTVSEGGTFKDADYYFNLCGG